MSLCLWPAGRDPIELLAHLKPWKLLAGRLILGTLAVLQLSGCIHFSSFGLPADEREAIGRHEMALVLFRFRCSSVTQPPYASSHREFDGSWDEFRIGFGVGSFASAGDPLPAAVRFLSKDSLTDGWSFLLLSPGTHYLAVGPSGAINPRGLVMPPQTFTGIMDWNRRSPIMDWPRWRFDIPPNQELVYVGTIQFPCWHEQLLFGAKVIYPDIHDDRKVQLLNEEALARNILAANFNSAEGMQTVLMRRWHKGDPQVIKTPPTNLKK